jgi:small GTP-binding protein
MKNTILLGKSTTGKTSIFTRLTRGKFNEITEGTIGVSFTKLFYNDTSYELYDTCGQERFFSLLPLYFRNVKIILFVFDVSDLSTLYIFSAYIDMIKNLENYKIIIIGNKIDLVNTFDIIIIHNIAKEMLMNTDISKNIFDYVYISTKTGENYDKLLNVLEKCYVEIPNDNILKIVNDDKCSC